MKKIFIVVLFTVLAISCKQDKKINHLSEAKDSNIRVSGLVFGTSYKIVYFSDKGLNYEKQFDSLFYVINKSMSNYQSNSDISKINRNEIVLIDDHFIKVFDTSKEIYKLTKGVFDPTIGVLVNAWDFGSEGEVTNINSDKINDLMKSVGLDKVLRNNRTIIKQNPETFLDFNAIAKGYAVDVVSKFLEAKSIENYLIEIGGEIRVKGLNIDGNKPWRIGLENPNFDGTQTIMKAINLTDEAMATSGTYRKFKVDAQGKKYAHIINPKTGYPSKTNILSISVLASDCMIADAYATGFKVMGIEKVKSFLNEHPELKAFLIFENDKKELETLSLNGFPEK